MHRATRTKLLVAALASLTCIFAAHGHAAAYTLAGYRWPGTPTSGCCASLYVHTFSSSDFLDTNNFNAYSNAYYYWSYNNGSGANVNWYLNSTLNSAVDDTNISWVSWDGLADVTHSSGSIVSTYLYLNNYYTSGYTWQSRMGVAAHEVGHQMGLGHEGSGCSLMIDNTPDRNTCSVFGPQSDDVNGINALY